jgi:outer membrane protein assembly factor BamB
MREMSRRQMLTGICAIATGVAARTPSAGPRAGPAPGPAPGKAARKTGRHTGGPAGSVLWRAQAGTATPSAFLDIVAGYGMVYASNLDGTGANLICAFDAGTGARAWQLSGPVWQMYTAAPGAVFWSTVAPGGQFASGQQVLVASSAAGGTRLWSFHSGWPNISVSDTAGAALVGGYGTLTGLDARTGRRTWGTGPATYIQQVAVDNGTAYATGYDSPGMHPGPSWVAALDPATGIRRWRLTGSLNGEFLSLAAGNGVVCGSESISSVAPTYALEASDGRELWQADTNSAVQAVSGGYVISSDTPFHGSTTLYGRRLSSGAPAWHRTLAADVSFMTCDNQARRPRRPRPLTAPCTSSTRTPPCTQSRRNTSPAPPSDRPFAATEHSFSRASHDRLHQPRRRT